MPLLHQFLQAFAGSELRLTLDTSMLWNQFCLVEVCLVWGGGSITLAQVVLEQGSATVAFEDYCPLLEQTLSVLPANSRITLLADRGFEHGELMRWCSLTCVLDQLKGCPNGVAWRDIGSMLRPPV